MELDDFTKAYLITALWSSTDSSTGEPLDKNYGFEDFAPKTLKKMKKDCDIFQKSHAEAIKDHPPHGFLGDGQNSPLAKAGHDFWLTRNHHGAGFWDGDWPVIGEKMTAASHDFGEVDLYVGDDGKIYAMGCE